MSTLIHKVSGSSLRNYHSEVKNLTSWQRLETRLDKLRLILDKNHYLSDDFIFAYFQAMLCSHRIHELEPFLRNSGFYSGDDYFYKIISEMYIRKYNYVSFFADSKIFKYRKFSDISSQVLRYDLVFSSSKLDQIII